MVQRFDASNISVAQWMVTMTTSKSADNAHADEGRLDYDNKPFRCAARDTPKGHGIYLGLHTRPGRPP